MTTQRDSVIEEYRTWCLLCLKATIVEPAWVAALLVEKLLASIDACLATISRCAPPSAYPELAQLSNSHSSFFHALTNYMEAMLGEETEADYLDLGHSDLCAPGVVEVPEVLRSVLTRHLAIIVAVAAAIDQ